MLFLEMFWLQFTEKTMTQNALFLRNPEVGIEGDCFSGQGYLLLSTLLSSGLSFALGMASHMAQMQESHPEEKAFLGISQISHHASLPRTGPAPCPSLMGLP